MQSLPILFGDVGGLYEFFATLAMTLIGAYQAKVFSLHQVRSLFRANRGGEDIQPRGEPKSLTQRHEIFMSTKTD